MAAGRIEPAHTLKGNSHVWFLWLWRGLWLQRHAGSQKLVHSRRPSATGSLFQHDLCLESSEVKFLFLQYLNKPLAAVDPSLSLCKRVDFILKFGDDRWHALP